ncbi:hypothetical protein BDZ97DRAFT_1845522 [Flammula alnicola]|nr:hypothetical protein BDZ97DRAFT_1845522 [Flammula alnicola]
MSRDDAMPAWHRIHRPVSHLSFPSNFHDESTASFFPDHHRPARLRASVLFYFFIS